MRQNCIFKKIENHDPNRPRGSKHVQQWIILSHTFPTAKLHGVLKSRDPSTQVTQDHNVCFKMFVVGHWGLVGTFGVSFAFSHAYSSSHFGGTLVGWCYACNVLWLSLFRLFRQVFSQCWFSKAVCSQAWSGYIYFVDFCTAHLSPTSPTFKIMVALRTCKLKKKPQLLICHSTLALSFDCTLEWIQTYIVFRSICESILSEKNLKTAES